MEKISFKRIFVVIMHAFIVWVLCGLTIATGRSVWTMQTTLKIHLIGAPFFATLVSAPYYKTYHFTTPMQTALIFLLFVIIMDAGIVAPAFEKNFAMFKSALGTWIPFLLIFLSTYITGTIIKGRISESKPGRIL